MIVVLRSVTGLFDRFVGMLIIFSATLESRMMNKHAQVSPTMTRKDLLPQVAVATLAACLTGCLSIPPAPADTPIPTRLESAGHIRVEVVWENSSDDAFVVSVVGAEPKQRAFALVEPCSAHNVIQVVDPPFEIGLGQRDVFVPEPMPTVVHSRDLDEPPDGLYRVHLSVGPDGAISSQPLTGYGSWEPPTGIC